MKYILKNSVHLFFICVCLIFLTNLIVFTDTKVVLAEQNNSLPTPRTLFSLLPTGIFENTGVELSEEEQQKLIDNGVSEDWIISQETSNELIINELSADNKVVLHVFNHNQGGVVVALGAQSGLICALELWRYDAKGKIIPMAVPLEPNKNDLFLPNALSAEIDTTIMLCLDHDKIKVKPILWGKDGVVNQKEDFEIHFFWNGNSFIQSRSPLNQ
ncbi:hypothetical protein [Desulfovibrio litoralis]|uniref:Uncharacterized protein n=1 Tax=Desulfovibrio litoralis DSM 11393 TaxID=1121455 RepID=A0A1M7TIP5_9BACT|nr:hypothetical protein [Desulfovibrio litoralis]SHN70590.1 hypothetical protein SAMN02745728_02056 [Desulfovibrio litoralis DSM 11393]